MIKAEDIEKVNSEIKPTDIKGKNYALVSDRIKAFRKVCPNGCITTKIISLQNGNVLMQATVTDEDGKMLGTGYAQEKEGGSFINKTSFIENAETSAIGRALGICGFGTNLDSLASAEEVANAQRNQQQYQQSKMDPKSRNSKGNGKVQPAVKKMPEKLTTKAVNELMDILMDENVDPEKFMAEHKIEKISDLPVPEYLRIYREYQQKKAKANG